jgi:hypothetical protein
MEETMKQISGCQRQLFRRATLLVIVAPALFTFAPQASGAQSCASLARPDMFITLAHKVVTGPF